MKLCWRGSTGHVRSIWYRANWLASLFCGLPCAPALLSHGMFRRPGATSATWHQSCFRNCPTDHCDGHHMLKSNGWSVPRLLSTLSYVHSTAAILSTMYCQNVCMWVHVCHKGVHQERRESVSLWAWSYVSSVVSSVFYFYHKIIVMLYTCALENVSILKMKYVL